jgi:transglutaminase-like putative cysteine protease
VIRLRPRSDITQSVRSFSLMIDPVPIQMSENLDLDGNSVIKVWFPDHATTRLQVKVMAAVETYRENPFAFLLDPSAVHLPVDYSASLSHQLQPYLTGASANFPVLDATVVALAEEVWQATEGSTVAFLTELNQRVYQHCRYIVRETGDPWPPGLTWREKSGSCRDLSVLFMAACRAMGLATRFVSGYHEGDPDWDQRHLHAWAEVYLPGAGWRGYDPTQGLAVGDRHIALVASPNSRHTAPISGSLKSGIGTASEMEYRLMIQGVG